MRQMFVCLIEEANAVHNSDMRCVAWHSLAGGRGGVSGSRAHRFSNKCALSRPTATNMLSSQYTRNGLTLDYRVRAW
jgi:hypothetical protein